MSKEDPVIDSEHQEIASIILSSKRNINYGSRIPDEIGNVTSINTSGHLNGYAESAVLADPRVQSLTDSVALYKEDQTVQLRLTVQPQGNGQSINLNEVIQPI